MAGAKGRSGGARVGAGRKRKQPAQVPGVVLAPVPVKAAKPVVRKPKPLVKAKAPPKPPQTKVIPKAVPEPQMTAVIPPIPTVIPPAPQYGPPPTDAEIMAWSTDPLEFLKAVWTGRQDASPTQLRAAAAALPFLHKKLGEGGKKDERQAKAEKVASRFAPVAAPRLVASNER